MNFLIIDDHSGLRAMIRDLAASMATMIHECVSGEEAIELCKRYAPDCITVDLRMPGMDGLTCIHHLRLLHPSAHIAVVTQFDNDALRARARQAGADTYVIKDNLEPLQHFFRLLSTQLGDE
ncbi:MAG TPA: response regulator transcription factor [Steroidobacteraceae bacterium]|jgi:DNA-binding NarL/FixJ family response regulator|nr:response regulator transcription factor [Steroidobacteraceae bacterium]